MILVTSAMFPPLFVIGLHWKNVCKPSLAGYHFIEECNESSYSEVGMLQQIFRLSVKVACFIGNEWVWYFGVHGTLFVVIAVHIMCTMMT